MLSSSILPGRCQANVPFIVAELVLVMVLGINLFSSPVTTTCPSASSPCSGPSAVCPSNGPCGYGCAICNVTIVNSTATTELCNQCSTSCTCTSGACTCGCGTAGTPWNSCQSQQAVCLTATTPAVCVPNQNTVVALPPGTDSCQQPPPVPQCNSANNGVTYKQACSGCTSNCTSITFLQLLDLITINSNILCQSTCKRCVTICTCQEVNGQYTYQCDAEPNCYNVQAICSINANANILDFPLFQQRVVNCFSLVM